MVDFTKRSKWEVTEIKFLIHDLRVEKFINNIIHFHTTLNTDLEIYSVEKAQTFHTKDLQKLKSLAYEMRKVLRKYSHAVRSFSPDQVVVDVGMTYIEKIREICELIFNPLWGRFDDVIPLLPDECRSVRFRSHYRNCVRWICGVYYRIEYFLQEYENRPINEEFDMAEDTYHFTNNIVLGYVTEKSASKVDIQFEKEGIAVIRGNKGRFRRMYFNLVMNAVDAMQENIVGVLKVRIFKNGKFVYLEVEDNGVGMSPDKIECLLSEKKNLDGELHSLGFVFVQQTIQEFDGAISVESKIGKGTKVTVSIPYLPGKKPSKVTKSKCEKYLGCEKDGRLPNAFDIAADSVLSSFSAIEGDRKKRESDRNANCGRIIWNDYQASKARHPGCIFSLSVNSEMGLDFFTHKPYEKYWNISHEDLSPMFFESTVRGRLEENEERKPELILKTPHIVKEFFDLKSLPENQRSSDTFVRMMHDEYVLIARKLITTGMPDDIGVHATNIRKYFKCYPDFFESEPIPISLLADQPLSTEHSG